MLAVFRGFLNTWVAKVFFLVLVASFALWGIGDVVRNVGQDTAVATVGSRRIEVPEMQDAFRRQLAQVSRMLGNRVEPTPQIRVSVAEQALERLVVQAAIAQEAARLGVAVPDEALRQAVFDNPNFRGRAGGFDRATFNAIMQSNNLTEQRYLELLRADLVQRQLIEAVRSGATAPGPLAREVFALQRETRVAELVELPFVGAAEPPAPDEADLRRYYENNPQAYSAAEYRRIKAVILSPESVARDIEVPDAELRAYYDQHRSEYVSAEKRSVEVVVAQEEEKAQTVATLWTSGAEWPTIEQTAQQLGASSVVLDDATQQEFPAAELGQAVFQANPQTVSGPIRSALGWQVFRVTKVAPGSERTFDQVREEVRAKVARDRAVDQVYTRANKLEDALSSGAPLDELPGDLGLAAIAGTLDAQGMTPQGEPAPIPGSPALRQALIQAAFQAAKGDQPRLIEGPEQSYYAFAVEETTPPALKPFETVEASVRDDWERDQRRREQDAVAARLLAAVKGGTILDDAATVAGVRMERTPPVSRNAPTPGIPRELVEPLFGLKRGEPTMVETPEGFVVAVLAEASSPDPASDPAGLSQIRGRLVQAEGEDLEITFAAALRDRANPRINRQLLNSIAQP